MSVELDCWSGHCGGRGALQQGGLGVAELVLEWLGAPGVFLHTRGGGHCMASYKPASAVTQGHFCPIPPAEAILGLPRFKAHVPSRSQWQSHTVDERIVGGGRGGAISGNYNSSRLTRLMTQFSLIKPLTVCLCFPNWCSHR